MAVTVLTQNPKTRIEAEVEGSTLLIRPVGVIDEDTNFSVVLAALEKLRKTAKCVQFDLGQVIRLNSCGVREWLLMMQQFPSTVPIQFVRVSEFFVEQANMIPTMIGGSNVTVLSFFAPYHCVQCNSGSSILIIPKEVATAGTSFKAPAQSCGKCTQKLKFDWLEDEYFGFLKRA